MFSIPLPCNYHLIKYSTCINLLLEDGHNLLPTHKLFQNTLLNTLYDFFSAMIDSLGGPDRVNNVLAALNLKPISQKNLKMIERRAGNFVESIAKSSMSKAAKDSFELEME